jgi:adenylate kinase family enzyme
MRFSEFDNLQEGPHDPHIFKAVFMSGSPGAGKTTVARMLFASSGLRSLNVDDFWKLYKVKGREVDYEKFWKLYTKREKPLRDERLGLLIDGTGKNPNVIKKIKTELEELGYETIMIYVNVDLETTKQRAQARASDPNSPDHGRHIDDEFITTTWNRVQGAKADLERIFGNGFFEVDNSGSRPDIRSVERKIRRWLEAPPADPKARQWIDQQRGLVKQQPARQRNTTQSPRPVQQTDVQPQQR